MRLALAALAAAGCTAGQGRDGLARIALRAGDPLAEVAVDGAPSGLVRDYEKAPLLVRPGHHRIEVKAGGAVQVREVDVGPSDQVALTVGTQDAQSAKGAP